MCNASPSSSYLATIIAVCTEAVVGANFCPLTLSLSSSSCSSLFFSLFISASHIFLVFLSLFLPLDERVLCVSLSLSHLSLSFVICTPYPSFLQYYLLLCAAHPFHISLSLSPSLSFFLSVWYMSLLFLSSLAFFCLMFQKKLSSGS